MYSIYLFLHINCLIPGKAVSSRAQDYYDGFPVHVMKMLYRRLRLQFYTLIVLGPMSMDEVDPKYLMPLFDRLFCCLPERLRKKLRCNLEFKDPEVCVLFPVTSCLYCSLSA